MKSSPYQFPLPAGIFFLAVILILMTATIGCTQPVQIPSIPSPFPATPAPTPSLGVTVSKPDASHIVVTYNGGPNMESLLELDATVTDSQGKSSTQHIGDKLATSPIRIGGTIRFEGAYAGSNHILVTGYSSDGSSRVVLQTDI